MHPRPILKHSHSLSTAHSVHFPPSTALTSTYSAHSAAAYDRSPIVVSPNNCALPERGCPGRTYTLEESAIAACPLRSHVYIQKSQKYPNDLHPRALAYGPMPMISSQSSRTSIPPIPALIPDLSSESDESDGFSSSSYPSSHSYSHSTPPTKHDIYPYSNAPPSPIYFSPDDQIHRPRRRRGERERRHESSRDPNRIRGDIIDSEIDGYAPDPLEAPATISRKSSRTKSQSRTSASYRAVCVSTNGFAITDDGCLGGF